MARPLDPEHLMTTQPPGHLRLSREYRSLAAGDIEERAGDEGSLGARQP